MNKLFPAGGVLLVALAGSACDVKVGGDGGLSLGITEGRASDEWTRTYTLPAGGTLEVVNVNGGIEVVPASGPQVEVVARRQARAGDDAAARDVLAKHEMLEEVSPARVKVEVPRGEGFSNGPFNRRWVAVNYRVSVPDGLTVSLRSQNGQISIEAVKGRLSVNNTNGGITAQRLSGTLDAQTVNGGIVVRMLEVTGDVKVGTVNGGIRIDVPAKVNANIEAHAVNGGVSVDDALTLSATQQERQHVVGRLNGGGPTISAQTVNGGVRVGASAQ